MKITALVENKSKGDLKAKHGLSLYIETKKHRVLFDLGPDATLFHNTRIKGIDLSLVDTVIISHGHMDHGGALERFLQINTRAKIYVQRKAFLPHYSKFLCFKASIGLNHKLSQHPQIVLVDGDYEVDEELQLFTVRDRNRCYSSANNSLYQGNQKDDFSHEQNLVIRGEENVVIMGCGHAGVVNIMEKAIQYRPTVCVGGYHLFNPLTKKTVSQSLLDQIAEELKKYPEVKFYTCHCTGEKAFDYLAQKMPNMHYLSCGEQITV